MRFVTFQRHSYAEPGIVVGAEPLAPAFDQAYLNLAKVYALEGAPQKARRVLQDLLQQHPDHPQAKQMLEQLQK